jgi:hypothetical protein
VRHTGWHLVREKLSELFYYSCKLTIELGVTKFLTGQPSNVPIESVEDSGKSGFISGRDKLYRKLVYPKGPLGVVVKLRKVPALKALKKRIVSNREEILGELKNRRQPLFPVHDGILRRPVRPNVFVDEDRRSWIVQQDGLYEELAEFLIPDGSTLIGRVEVEQLPLVEISEPGNRLRGLSPLQPLNHALRPLERSTSVWRIATYVEESLGRPSLAEAGVGRWRSAVTSPLAVELDPNHDFLLGKGH